MTEAKRPEFPPTIEMLSSAQSGVEQVVHRDWVQNYADACVAHATAPLLATIKRQQDLLDMALAAMTERELADHLLKSLDAIAAIQAERKESWG